MSDTVQEYFSEVISVYTREQGIEDGILIRNPYAIFAECDVITTNLWHYIEERCTNCILTEPIELLGCPMKQAKYIHDRKRFKGDNDKDFFVIEGNGKIKPVWFVRNENNKLTGMLASDY